MMDADSMNANQCATHHLGGFACESESCRCHLQTVAPIATALGLPEKIGIVLETERNEGKKYAHVKWIGYTEDSVATEEDLLGVKTKNTQWVLFSDIIVLAKAIDE